MQGLPLRYVLTEISLTMRTVLRKHGYYIFDAIVNT